MAEGDEEDYQRGVEQLKYNVIEKPLLHRDDSILTTMQVKEKNLDGLKINNLKVIPIGKGSIIFCPIT